MVFPAGPIPAPDHQLDHSTDYVADVPFDNKQALISTKRHRWFQVWDIGTVTGPYTLTPGLGQGATQRIQFDHRPDVVMVSISGQTANTGRVSIFLGEPGGVPIRLGPTGKVVVPAPEGGIITIVNVGTTATYGTVIAVAGYQWNPSIDIYPGT